MCAGSAVQASILYVFTRKRASKQTAGEPKNQCIVPTTCKEMNASSLFNEISDKNRSPAENTPFLLDSNERPLKASIPLDNNERLLRAQYHQPGIQCTNSSHSATEIICSQLSRDHATNLIHSPTHTHTHADTDVNTSTRSREEHMLYTTISIRSAFNVHRMEVQVHNRRRHLYNNRKQYTMIKGLRFQFKRSKYRSTLSTAGTQHKAQLQELDSLFGKTKPHNVAMQQGSKHPKLAQEKHRKSFMCHLKRGSKTHRFFHTLSACGWFLPELSEHVLYAAFSQSEIWETSSKTLRQNDYHGSA